MRIKRQFDVSLGIKDAIDFCARKKENAERLIENTYAGICFMGCYISEIISVDTVSECEIVLDNLDMEGRVNVQFTAYVILYGMWDIIVGVRVVRKSDFLIGEFQGSDDDAPMTVTVLNTDQAETVAVDQTIAVRIHTVDYPPFQPRVMGVGIMLTCDKKSPSYSVVGKLSPKEVAKWVELIEYELGKRSEFYDDETTFKRLLFFENLLITGDSKTTEKIPVKGAGAWVGPKISVANRVNLIEIAKTGGDVSGSWSRPTNVPRSSPIVAFDSSAGSDASTNLISTTIVFEELLKNMYTYLKATRELTASFDESMIISHENIWASMAKTKKQK